MKVLDLGRRACVITCVDTAKVAGCLGRRYPSDLTDERWTLIEPLLPVERTLAWLTAHRRLARDYERDPAISEAMIC